MNRRLYVVYAQNSKLSWGDAMNRRLYVVYAQNYLGETR